MPQQLRTRRQRCIQHHCAAKRHHQYLPDRCRRFQVHGAKVSPRLRGDCDCGRPSAVRVPRHEDDRFQAHDDVALRGASAELAASLVVVTASFSLDPSLFNAMHRGSCVRCGPRGWSEERPVAHAPQGVRKLGLPVRHRDDSHCRNLLVCLLFAKLRNRTPTSWQAYGKRKQIA